MSTTTTPRNPVTPRSIPSPLTVSCPWCHAAVGTPCSTPNRGFARGKARTPRRLRTPHDARITEATRLHLTQGVEDPWGDWTPEK